MRQANIMFCRLSIKLLRAYCCRPKHFFYTTSLCSPTFSHRLQCVQHNKKKILLNQYNPTRVDGPVNYSPKSSSYNFYYCYPIPSSILCCNPLSIYFGRMALLVSASHDVLGLSLRLPLHRQFRQFFAIRSVGLCP